MLEQLCPLGVESLDKMKRVINDIPKDLYDVEYEDLQRMLDEVERKNKLI